MQSCEINGILFSRSDYPLSLPVSRYGLQTHASRLNAKGGYFSCSPWTSRTTQGLGQPSLAPVSLTSNSRYIDLERSGDEDWIREAEVTFERFAISLIGGSCWTSPCLLCKTKWKTKSYTWRKKISLLKEKRKLGKDFSKFRNRTSFPLSKELDPISWKYDPWQHGFERRLRLENWWNRPVHFPKRKNKRFRNETKKEKAIDQNIQFAITWEILQKSSYKMLKNLRYRKLTSTTLSLFRYLSTTGIEVSTKVPDVKRDEKVGVGKREGRERRKIPSGFSSSKTTKNK